jgi:hypothetical protein
LAATNSLFFFPVSLFFVDILVYSTMVIPWVVYIISCSLTLSKISKQEEDRRRDGAALREYIISGLQPQRRGNFGSSTKKSKVSSYFARRNELDPGDGFFSEGLQNKNIGFSMT